MKNCLSILFLFFISIFIASAQTAEGSKYQSLQSYYADFCPAYHKIISSMPQNFEAIKGEKKAKHSQEYTPKLLLPMCYEGSLRELALGYELKYDFSAVSDSMVSRNTYTILKSALLNCKDADWTSEEKVGRQGDDSTLVQRFVIYDKTYQEDTNHMKGSYVYVDWTKSAAGIYNISMVFYHL
jgi:hypothetical protein